MYTLLLILVLICVLIALYWISFYQKKIIANQTVIPFTSSVTLDTNIDIPKTNDGKNQISCPVGNVNIIGAFFEVYDPYQTCTDLKEELKTFCSKKENKNVPTCLQLDEAFKNSVCSKKCKLLDVSDLVSTICNGKKECTAEDFKKLSEKLPLPCKLTDKQEFYLPVTSDSAKQGYILHGVYTCESI